MTQLMPLFDTQITERISISRHDPAFTKGNCEKVLSDYLIDSPKVAKVSNQKKSGGARKSKVHPIPYTDESKWLYEFIADRAGRYNKYDFDFNLSGIYEELQLIEYDEGDYYDYHMDMGDKATAYRKLSVIIQLSDPDTYEGGDVVFNHGKEDTLPRDQGMFCVFPSYVLHKVTPVTKGKRYSLVSWIMSGSRFR